jgi:CBS domain-containing protein
LERLTALHEAEIIKDESYREMIYVFDYLWKLRFFNQIKAVAELRVDGDELDIERLSEIERDNLQSVLSRIPVF